MPYLNDSDDFREYSWVWHPFHGSAFASGYMSHYEIFRDHPELKELEVVENTHSVTQSFAPPKGYFRVEHDTKTIIYVRVDSLLCGSRNSLLKKVKVKVPVVILDQDSRRFVPGLETYTSKFYDDPTIWEHSGEFEFIYDKN